MRLFRVVQSEAYKIKTGFVSFCIRFSGYNKSIIKKTRKYFYLKKHNFYYHNHIYHKNVLACECFHFFKGKSSTKYVKVWYLKISIFLSNYYDLKFKKKLSKEYCYKTIFMNWRRSTFCLNVLPQSNLNQILTNLRPIDI